MKNLLLGLVMLSPAFLSAAALPALTLESVDIKALKFTPAPRPAYTPPQRDPSETMPNPEYRCNRPLVYLDSWRAIFKS